MTELRAAYRAAGVDVAAGDRAVELIKARLGSSGQNGPLGGLGGFGAAVPLPPGYTEPVLVSATDGVGTKTAIASALGRYDTIGHDLVAMCADDVVCHGARPLFFLDYVAVGRLEPRRVAELVSGVAAGCDSAGCALVGGETAEHPGLMAADAFDVAGFCVGVVERSQLLDGTGARAGDAIVGIASSGLHANGFSLVRDLVARFELDLGGRYLDAVRLALGASEAERVAQEEPERASATLGDVLLEPTRIYARDMLALRDELAAVGTPLAGLAHITGGGLHGNVPRALPADLAARIDPSSWSPPSIFRLVTALGSFDGPALRATFNAGVGMVAVVGRSAVKEALSSLRSRGHEAWVIGEVVPLEPPGGARYVEVVA